MFSGLGTVKNFNQCLVQWLFIGYSGKLWMCEVSCQQYGIPGKILFTYLPLNLFICFSAKQLDLEYRHFIYFFESLYFIISFLNHRIIYPLTGKVFTKCLYRFSFLLSFFLSPSPQPPGKN